MGRQSWRKKIYRTYITKSKIYIRMQISAIQPIDMSSNFQFWRICVLIILLLLNWLFTFFNCPIITFIFQLNAEREAKRAFSGFDEGRIFFSPTYKYSHNSDAYAGETVKSKKKGRTPSSYFHKCFRIIPKIYFIFKFKFNLRKSFLKI